MNTLMKLNKTEIIEKFVENENEIQRYKLLENKLVNSIRQLESKLADTQKENIHTNKKLTDIQQSIITAAAMKHPDTCFNHYVDQYSIQAEPRNTDEPEDLLLLRHLYKLTA